MGIKKVWKIQTYFLSTVFDLIYNSYKKLAFLSEYVLIEEMNSNQIHTLYPLTFQALRKMTSEKCHLNASIQF